MRLPNLPDEIINLILSYAPNFRDKLKNCHYEMLDNHRPCYFKKCIAGFSPGIADSPNWHNFKNNDKIRIWNHNHAGPMQYMILKLHAIEITPHRPPNDRHWHARDIILYYGWSKATNKYFWNTVLQWNKYRDEFTPGYY